MDYHCPRCFGFNAVLYRTEHHNPGCAMDLDDIKAEFAAAKRDFAPLPPKKG